jgi:hypothetical protein
VSSWGIWVAEVARTWFLGLIAALPLTPLTSAFAQDFPVHLLQEAIVAYDSGDLGKARELLSEADHFLQEDQSEILGMLLPEAPVGFTKTVDDNVGVLLRKFPKETMAIAQ